MRLCVRELPHRQRGVQSCSLVSMDVAIHSLKIWVLKRDHVGNLVYTPPMPRKMTGGPQMSVAPHCKLCCISGGRTKMGIKLRCLARSDGRMSHMVPYRTLFLSTQLE